MQRPLCLLVIFVLAISQLKAQDDDKNVVIKHAKEEYAFVKGNSGNPVKVKQELSISYLCNDYRTTIQVAEFYNDQVSLDDVEVKVDGDRQKNFRAYHDYYNSDGIFYSDARVLNYIFHRYITEIKQQCFSQMTFPIS